MGWSAARKLRRAVASVQRVVGIELMTACRALELRAPVSPSPATSAVLAKVRESVPGVGPDRFLAPEMAAAEQIVRSGVLTHVATSVIGPCGHDHGSSAN